MADDFDLSQFDETYRNAPAEEQPVPEGKYDVTVERVELTRSKTSDNPMLSWQLRIMGSDCEGRMLFRHNMLLSESNIEWLKRDLHKCGLDLDKLSDLPNHLDQLLDLHLQVTVRMKDDIQNVYINRRLDDPEEDDTAGGFPVD